MRTGLYYFRSLEVQMFNELPECYVSTKVSPPYPVVHSTYNGGVEALESASQFNYVWMMLRSYSSNSQQVIPPWSGWVSITGQY